MRSQKRRRKADSMANITRLVYEHWRDTVKTNKDVLEDIAVAWDVSKRN